jgi:probable DNA metabolism protein
VRAVTVALGPDGWRDAVRELLREQLPPDRVRLAGPGESAGVLDLFGAPSIRGAAEAAGTGTRSDRSRPTAPRRFFEIARRVACHVDPGRYDLLYRLAWRLTHGEPELLEDRADPDVARLFALESAVRRDAHKTKAFVRFRRLDDDRFVAWHGAEHRVLRLLGEFFAERFSDMTWAIFTPHESAAFDGRTLAYGEGMAEHQREARGVPSLDALDETWRAYYAAIFNPARVNPRAMRTEMPVKHWRTLPEARLIPGLVASAVARTAAMADVASPRPDAALAASAAASWPAWSEALAGCAACPLHETATVAVPGTGAGGGILVLGEQPGDEEDRLGVPFVGPAGQLLDEALREAGLDRSEIYLTNAVKHFRFEPRGDRRLHQRPTLEHVRACRPWLVRELELTRPRIVVALGVTAARAMLGQTVRMDEVRGRLVACDLVPAVLPTWHPAAVLRAATPADGARMRTELVQALARARTVTVELG